MNLLNMTSKNVTQTKSAANQVMRKMCFRKCKTCKGMKCPNYFGASRKDFKQYYSGVLHSRKPRFALDVMDVKQQINKTDWQLIGCFVLFTILLLIFGGVMI